MPSGRRCRSGRIGWAWIAQSCFERPSGVTWSDYEANRMPRRGCACRPPRRSCRSGTLPIGGRLKTGRTGPMRRGEIWFAATPGGDRPVLVLTRDPVADRIDSVVVAALTRTRRGLVSELVLTAAEDGVPSDCV